MFKLTHPAELRSAVLFASPHSGCDYTLFPADVILSPEELRSSEDVRVDELLGDVGQFGCIKLAATAPRAFVDLNRDHDELDPALFEGAPRLHGNPRVAAGLGVIARVVSKGRPIYSGKLPVAEGERRLKAVWHPYHEALEAALGQIRSTLGRAVLIDVHSMPHEAVERRDGAGAQIVLGDRFGRSACASLVEAVEQIFVQAGFRVSRNAPFAGAYIVERYGRPAQGVHAIQIEIDRSLYQDPQNPFGQSAKFVEFRDRLRPCFAKIAELGAQAHDCVDLAAQ